MIYNTNNKYNTYTESVALFGQDADEFLESVEVALYEDSVSIGENVYNGTEAEAFLAENGIMLYEDHIVLEGKQAEEYKARKEKEKYDAYRDDEKKNKKLSFGKYDALNYPNARKYASKYNTGLLNTVHDYDSSVKDRARYMHRKDFDNKLKNDGEFMNAIDARQSDIERHIRKMDKKNGKTVKNESTIFDFDLK